MKPLGTHLEDINRIITINNAMGNLKKKRGHCNRVIGVVYMQCNVHLCLHIFMQILPRPSLPSSRWWSWSTVRESSWRKFSRAPPEGNRTEWGFLHPLCECRDFSVVLVDMKWWKIITSLCKKLTLANVLTGCSSPLLDSPEEDWSIYRVNLSSHQV